MYFFFLFKAWSLHKTFFYSQQSHAHLDCILSEACRIQVAQFKLFKVHSCDTILQNSLFRACYLQAEATLIFLRKKNQSRLITFHVRNQRKILKIVLIDCILFQYKTVNLFREIQLTKLKYHKNLSYQLLSYND